MRKQLRLACFATITILGFASSSANAAIVAFTDLASFQAAATGTESVIDFESFGAGATLTTVGDVTFSEATGSNLEIFNTFPGDTISPSNYVGDDFGFEQLTDFEVVNIGFGSARSAVGLWVAYDPFNITNNGVISLRDTTMGALGGVQVDVNEGSGVFLDNDSGFFIGLVDDTGANSITSVSLQENGVDTIAYTFDNVTSYQVTAVPEPSTTVACCALAGAFVMRRRRKKKVIA